MEVCMAGEKESARLDELIAELKTLNNEDLERKLIESDQLTIDEEVFVIYMDEYRRRGLGPPV